MLERLAFAGVIGLTCAAALQGQSITGHVILVLYYVFVMSVVLLGATDCISRHDYDYRGGGCSAGAQLLLQVLAWGWVARSATVIITGWKGFLLGARRSRRVSGDVAVI